MYSKKIRSVMLTLFISPIFPLLLSAHGVEILVKQQPPCVSIRVFYHGGRGMKDASLTIRLENQDNVYQTGKTDKNGVFSFIPDQTGKWLIIADDGLGHLKKFQLDITAEFFHMPPDSGNEKKPGETSLAENAPPPLPASAAAPAPVEKKAPYPAEIQNPPHYCCFLLKIVLGILLILGITLIIKKLSGKTVTKS